MTINGQKIRVEGRLIRIARLDGEKYESAIDPLGAVSALRAANERADLFTFMQIMPDTSPLYELPMEWDNLAVLPVSTYEQWWNLQIRSYPRNRARQAEKRGVVIREVAFNEDLSAGICGVYNESAVRQGRPNYHYGKDKETVHRETATYLDRSIFIGAYLEGVLIGFAKLVTDPAGVQANLMNIVAMISQRDKCPTNALIAYSVKACAKRGIRYLVYQAHTYPGKKADSLTEFKELNGFVKVDLPRYYLPITPLGRLAIRAGWHRGLAGQLPSNVVEAIRRVRGLWYRQSQPMESLRD